MDDESITIKAVFKSLGTSIRYIYDFGDWWEHTVTLEEQCLRLAEELIFFHKYCHDQTLR